MISRSYAALLLCSTLSISRYGHLNNSVYFHFFDSIINAYLIQSCGRDPKSSEEIGIVVSSYCEYFASLSFPTVVEVGVRVSKLGKTSVTYEVGVFEQGVDEPRAVGGYTHVFVDRKTRNPIGQGMPAGLRRGLERLAVDSAPKL